MDRRKIAVIDLGTNTFHLMIGEICGVEKSISYKEKIMVRLGEKGISKREITIEAQKRALTALKRFKKIIEEEHIPTACVFATATSAMRSAKNASVFLKNIEEEVGIKVKIISGQTEAKFIYEGVKRAVKLSDEPSLIMDIGGGSIEFIICNVKTIFWKGSFEVGAQRLLDLFHQIDPIPLHKIDELEHYLDKKLQELIEKGLKYKPVELIGSSGTFDTLVSVYKADDTSSYINETESVLPVDDFERIYESLIKKNRSERLAIKGMSEMRVDMIVVASCLIHHILKYFNFTQIKVSSFALKEGVFFTA